MANDCFNANLDGCTDNFFVYTGNKATDIYGNICSKWTDNVMFLTIKMNDGSNAEIYFYDFVGDHNYCRNAWGIKTVGCIVSKKVSPCFNICTSTTAASSFKK